MFQKHTPEFDAFVSAIQFDQLCAVAADRRGDVAWAVTQQVCSRQNGSG